MIIDGVNVTADFDITEDEAQAYIDLERKRCPGEEITALDLHLDDEGYVSGVTNYKRPEFERIRRITGYLVGTLDRFNDAKRAEESDRVKHTV